MSADRCAYRTRDPRAVQAWKDAWAAREAYITRTDEIVAESGLAGHLPAYRLTGPWNMGRFVGISALPGVPRPHGWRSDGECLVPDRRTKAGKEIHEAIEAVLFPGAPSEKLPGMPGRVFKGYRMHTPGVFVGENGAALYVIWSAEPGRPDAVDPAVWEPIPLSVYYAEDERTTAERAQ